MADTTTPTTASNINTISSSTLQPQTKLVVPTPKPDTTPYESLIQGALTSLPSVTSQVASAQKANEDMLAGFASTATDISNKEAYSQQQQDIAGVKAKQDELDALDAQFTDLGAQIKGLSRKNSASPLITQENNLGRGTSIEGTEYQTDDMQRRNAIKALQLASEGDILGAQVTNAEKRLQRAKDNAQLAVDLKYKPLEAKNALLKDMLELNSKYVLEPAEKKKVEATNIALAERTRLLAEKKQDEKDNTALVINANSQNAPASLMKNVKAMIEKGAKPADIANALGVYAGDYIGMQVKLKDMKLKDLEYAIKTNEFNLSRQPPIAQNADGSIVRGSGASSVDRNTSTVEQIIKRNAKIIPDSAQTSIGNANQVIRSIQEFAKLNPDGTFEGMYPTAGFMQAITPDKFRSDKTVANQTALGAIELKTQMWASGASLTEAQTKLVEGMVPKKGDTDNVVKQKLKSLTDYMNLDVAGRLSSAGINYRPESTDFYDTSVATKVKNAVGAGYTPAEIVTSYQNDATLAPKITQAKQAGWKDEDIVVYLQSLQEQAPTQKDVQRERNKQIMESRPFGG